jgi:hypothetical protein
LGQYFLRTEALGSGERDTYSALSNGSMSAILSEVMMKLGAVMRGTMEVMWWGRDKRGRFKCLSCYGLWMYSSTLLRLSIQTCG